MPIPLILFFTSLLSIIVMIARKLRQISKEIPSAQEFPVELPYLEEVKENTIRNLKKHGYVALVACIRYYVRGVNFVRSEYQAARVKVLSWRHTEKTGEKKESSKFLRTIGEYKEKIREIKHRISKEESL